MSDRIEIKDLDLLETVDDTDEIAVQRKADGVVYKAEKSTLKGDKGDAGDAATVDAGTTTTGAVGTDATVVNSGTTSAAVFDFTIPRGDKGETGDTGPKGDPGVVQSIVAGSNVTVDDTDPANPIVSSTGEGGSFTVATPEEINTGEDNEKGVTPQGLRDSLYPRVYRQDEEPTLADGDVWVNTGEEELVQEEVEPVSTLLLETDARTADYTLQLTDQDKIVLMNKASAATLTVPTNAAVAFPIGAVVGVYNSAADDVLIVGDTGVTVRNVGDVAQYGEVSLRKRAENEWVVVGEIKI